MALRSLAAVVVFACLVGCDEAPLQGPQPATPIQLKSPPIHPAPQTGPITQAPGAATPLTRDSLRTMYEQRDTHCGTGDPWFVFADRAKEPAEIELLKAWAVDPAASLDGRRAAVSALLTEKGPAMLGWWRQELERSAPDSPERPQLFDAVLSAGGADEVKAAYSHLGESDAMDRLLIGAAMGHRELAAPLLRAYQRSNKARPKIQVALTRVLLKLDPAHAEGDAAALLSAGDEESVSAVLQDSEPSAALLQKYLPLLDKPDPDGFLHEEIAHRIALGLNRLLQDDDAGAVQLAQKWSKPDPATARLLEEAPAVSLVIALWHQSRGELASASAAFRRGLAKAPPAPREGDPSGKSSPQVAYAATMVHHACMLESTGQRAAAIAQLRTFEGWAEPVRHHVDNLLSNLRFHSYDPVWCYQSISVRKLEAMPLVLTAKRQRTKRGFRFTLDVRSESARPVSVRACSAAGGGFLPGDGLSIRLGGGGRLEAPLGSCQSTAKWMEPGSATSVTLEGTPPRGEVAKGLMRLSFRPQLSTPSELELSYLFGVD